MAVEVLIADDNVNLTEAIRYNLEEEGYETVIAGDGQEAMRAVYAERPDLVILDIMMPKLDGWQVCQRVREMSDVPIIMLTARGERTDIVKGLDLGADDYLVKPFGVDELLARVRALLRRAATAPQPDFPGGTKSLSDGYLSVELDSRLVTLGGKPISLTPTEYRVLALLAQSAGRVVSFRQILEDVWGFEYTDEVCYVHTYIWHLRRKLELDPKNPRYLLNELDVGYRLVL